MGESDRWRSLSGTAMQGDDLSAVQIKEHLKTLPMPE